MKRILSLGLALTMVFALAACGSSKAQGKPESDSKQQIPNPIIDCNTLEEAENLADIKITVPDTINGFADCLFRAYDGLNMIEVIYQNEAAAVSIRKACGDNDISGDFNDYAQMETVSVDNIQVTMKGADDLYCLAIWTNDGNTYAVSADTGLSLEEMTELVSAIQ